MAGGEPDAMSKFAGGLLDRVRRHPVIASLVSVLFWLGGAWLVGSLTSGGEPLSDVLVTMLGIPLTGVVLVIILARFEEARYDAEWRPSLAARRKGALRAIDQFAMKFATLVGEPPLDQLREVAGRAYRLNDSGRLSAEPDGPILMGQAPPAPESTGLPRILDLVSELGRPDQLDLAIHIGPPQAADLKALVQELDELLNRFANFDKERFLESMSTAEASVLRVLEASRDLEEHQALEKVLVALTVLAQVSELLQEIAHRTETSLKMVEGLPLEMLIILGQPYADQIVHVVGRPGYPLWQMHEWYEQLQRLSVSIVHKEPTSTVPLL